ncbi:glycoside hydrolase family 43 protein [Paenibacillus ihbetae]|uniref:Alpha-N-arabinofuranosidase n=1 Tax=Paenibacillus ihbetae TaxID=1870820 RepID=A0A1B2DW00_9BACL|nr:family 43 glycosylhydrolase [Paenibacillus ihbetae]ANY71900.1 alpha-N-arabinofuranosidase [Paenibacillus ihbetae]OOC60795.1 alpha-N-arabinofuranosidase [Paenibacillus ihbetae]
MSELKLNNPLIEQRADPWIYKHTDGYYYFTASVPEYDRIELRRARTIAGLAEAEAKTIWVKHETGWMSANIWAPEIHYIDGKWYVYYAAAHTSETRDGLFDHRMFVIENEAANPLEGEWVEKGQVVTKWESFALDATTFEHRGTRYYVWAQKDPGIPGNSNLYISEMENPWTLKGDQVLISKPEYDWEKQGYLVNEGAAILKRNGRIFMTYSASATDHNYCMGLLTADESSDLLNPNSWSKSPKPVFTTSEANGQYGPGHNSFTVSEDGTQDILVYHARSYKEIEGDPLYDPNRHTRVQLIRWHEDGTPDFGVPRPDTKLVNAD